MKLILGVSMCISLILLLYYEKGIVHHGRIPYRSKQRLILRMWVSISAVVCYQYVLMKLWKYEIGFMYPLHVGLFLGSYATSLLWYFFCFCCKFEVTLHKNTCEVNVLTLSCFTAVILFIFIHKSANWGIC